MNDHERRSAALISVARSAVTLNTLAALLERDDAAVAIEAATTPPQMKSALSYL